MIAPRDPWAISADAFPVDGTSEEKLGFMANYAILAPSTHNTQPWIFRVHSNQLDLLADETRALRVIDPEGRELLMSCGAALFHLRVAMQYFGFLSRIDLVPEPAEPALLARVHLGFKCETDGEEIVLFLAIPKRRTNRQPFSADPVPDAIIAELTDAAHREGASLHVVQGDEARSAVADLVARADLMQWHERGFRDELAHWIHPDQQYRVDGLTASSQGVGSWGSRGGGLLMRTFDKGKGHAAHDKEIALYSPTLAVLATEADTREAWLQAGQALARVLLQAQSEGVSASFLNQPIEVAELRTRLAETLGFTGCPQVLLRLGYGPEVPPMPRRPLHDVLVWDRHGSIDLQSS